MDHVASCLACDTLTTRLPSRSILAHSSSTLSERACPPRGTGTLSRLVRVICATAASYASRPTSLTTVERSSMPTSTTPKKLTAADAAALDEAEVRYEATKQQYEAAKRDRDELRAKLRPKTKSRVEQIVGGILVKRTAYSYDTFSLKDYKAAGNVVTKAMAKFVKRQRGEHWTVKRVK